MDNSAATSIASPARERARASFAELENNPDRQHVNAGTVLFHEGDAPHGMFIVHTGRLDLIWHRGKPGERRRGVTVGEIVGLPAVISASPHLYTAIARTACEVSFIPCETFSRLVDDNPKLWFTVLRQLSQNVNESYDLIRKESRRNSR